MVNYNDKKTLNENVERELGVFNGEVITEKFYGDNEKSRDNYVYKEDDSKYSRN